MSNIQWHLLLNHLPLFFPIFGAFLYLGGILKKTVAVEKVGLLFLVLGGLSVYPAYKTGDDSEHEIRSYACRGLRVEEHEKSATFALYATLVAGFVGLIVLLLCSKKPNVAHSVGIRLLVLVVAFSSFAITARSAHLGGLIGHEELHPRWREKEPSLVYCP